MGATEPDRVPIQEALRRIMGAVGVIGKGNTMRGDGYQYRSIEDVMPVTTPLLVEHGVIVTPRVLNRSVSPHFNGKEYRWEIEVEWTFTGPSGDTLVTSTIGDALDTRDKGANKAMTASLKQALTTVFQIAVKGAFDDPDHYGKDADGAKPVNAAWVKNGLLARAQELGWSNPIDAATSVWRKAGWDGNAFDRHAAETLVASMPEPESVTDTEGGATVVGSGSETPSMSPAKEPDPASPKVERVEVIDETPKSAKRAKVEKKADELGVSYTDDTSLSELVNAVTDAATAKVEAG